MLFLLFEKKEESRVVEFSTYLKWGSRWRALSLSTFLVYINFSYSLKMVWVCVCVFLCYFEYIDVYKFVSILFRIRVIEGKVWFVCAHTVVAPPFLSMRLSLLIEPRTRKDGENVRVRTAVAESERTCVLCRTKSRENARVCELNRKLYVQTKNLYCWLMSMYVPVSMTLRESHPMLEWASMRVHSG